MSDAHINSLRGRYLSPEEFNVYFQRGWDSMSRRFFKFEALQAYDEGKDSAYHAFVNEKSEAFSEQLRTQREEDRMYYEAAQRRGVTLLRLHEISVPLSDYVRYEYYAYAINRSMGEQIYLLDTHLRQQLKLPSLTDFVAFDDHLLLMHDYTESGRLLGAWHVDDREKIREVLSLAECLVNAATPFTGVPEDSLVLMGPL